MSNKKKFDEITDRAKRRFDLAKQAEAAQRRSYIEDLTFCDVKNQWDDWHVAERAGRPYYVVDKINPLIAHSVNAFTQNPPSIKVSAVDSNLDEDVADTINGLIKSIEFLSNGKSQYVTAYECAVIGGLGYLQVGIKQYDDSNPFELDIFVDAIDNPLRVHIDPLYKDPSGADIRWAFLSTDYAWDEFREAYPEVDIDGYRCEGWEDEGDEIPTDIIPIDDDAPVGVVRVITYWEKTRKLITYYKLKDGQIIKKDDAKDIDPDTIVDAREGYDTIVNEYKMVNNDVIETRALPIRHIPIVPVFGRVRLDKDGKRDYVGMVRSAKDPCLMYNLMRTKAIDAIMLTDDAPWVAAKGAIDGLEGQWRNPTNLRVLEYNSTDTMTGLPAQPPQRQMVEPPVQALAQASQQADEDLKSVTGKYDPVLGQKQGGNESGIAIARLQQQGEITQFHFADHLSNALRLVGRIIIDLIPYVYDSERIIRIIGEDGQEKTRKVNSPEDEKAVDLTNVSKYDVTVATGPSYNSRRQENLSVILEMAKIFPQIQQVGAPDIVALLDINTKDDLVRKLKAMLPPGVSNDEDNKELPPEVMAQLQQMQQTIQALTESNQQLEASANKEQTKLALEAAKLELEEKKLKQQMEIEALKLENDLIKAKFAAEGAADAQMTQLNKIQGQKVSKKPAPMEREEEPNEPNETNEYESQEGEE